MGGASRLLAGAPFVAALLWAATGAIRLGTSDSAAHDAASRISTWVSTGAWPGPEAIHRISSALRETGARDPTNPFVHELLGRLALASRDEDAGEKAIGEFGVALQHRPTSAYSWAGLAESLYRNGQTGALFQQALQTAAATGPWEPQVQLTVVNYGLAVWSEVGAETRSAIERMVANGMVRNAPEILQISERRGRLGVACAHLGSSTRTDPKWIQLCKGTEAT